MSIIMHRCPLPGPDVLRLFDSPDFLYRTDVPELLDAAGVASLLDAGTWRLEREGVLLGLWSATRPDSNGWGLPEFRRVHQLHLRLRGDAPLDDWIECYAAVERVLVSRDEVERVSWWVSEGDDAGRRAAAALGFTREGVLPGLLERDGRAQGVEVHARTGPVLAGPEARTA